MATHANAEAAASALGETYRISGGGGGHLQATKVRARMHTECKQAVDATQPEQPPRDKRARAAFFRAKDARRAAKQQRKKELLWRKVAGTLVVADAAQQPQYPT